MILRQKHKFLPRFGRYMKNRKITLSPSVPIYYNIFTNLSSFVAIIFLTFSSFFIDIYHPKIVKYRIVDILNLRREERYEFI